MLLDRAQRFDAVAGLADDLHAVQLAEQKAQLVARAAARRRRQARAAAASSIGQARDPRRHDQLGDHDARARAFAGHAIELQLVIRAVDHAQALVDVAQADAAAALTRSGVIGRDADAVVDDVDDRVAVLARAADRDPALRRFSARARA